MVTNNQPSFSGKAVLSLSILLAFRMLGLFMIYPVFSVAAADFDHATPTLIGIALGIYGLTQGLFQLPLSALSDRYGRRSIILSGLSVFGLGSILAACAHSIYVIIIGRALQGCGAIGSTVMAFAADLTSTEQRTKAMAILGMTIGVSFAVALVLGPTLSNLFGLSGLFWLTAILAAVGIVILFFGTPKIVYSSSVSRVPLLSSIKQLVLSHKLIALNMGIFLLHAILTASFIVLPELLTAKLGLIANQQWKIYLPILFAVFLVIFPLLKIADRKTNTKTQMLISVALMSSAQFIWFYLDTKLIILFALLLFFIGFTFLESILPSLVSKFVPVNIKGTAMGIFSTWQFLGIFIGGLIGGMIQQHFGSYFVCLCCGILGVLWFFNIVFSVTPTNLKLNSQLNDSNVTITNV